MSLSTPPPDSIQRAVISGGFNSAILSILLTGIYTSVYTGTMYVSLTSRGRTSRFVLCVITLLYLSNVGQTILQWLQLTQQQRLIGQPVSTFFTFTLSPSHGMNVASSLFLYLSSVLGDVLIIWRCYHICRSIRSVAFLLVLLALETGLYFAVIVSNILHGLQVVLLDLTAIAILVTFTTTLLATVMIIFKIMSAMKECNAIVSTRIQRIIKLLVESSAIYAVVSLLWAISILGFAHTQTNLNWYVLGFYADAIFNTFAGMAPTIMVARLCMSPEDKTVISTLFSTLKFERNDGDDGCIQVGLGRTISPFDDIENDMKSVNKLDLPEPARTRW